MRRCVFCSILGDQVKDSAGRLLYVGLDEWVHINCALWSAEVYEDDSGRLKNVNEALKRGNKLVRNFCWCLLHHWRIFYEFKIFFLFLLKQHTYDISLKGFISKEGTYLTSELYKYFSFRNVNLAIDMVLRLVAASLSVQRVIILFAPSKLNKIK